MKKLCFAAICMMIVAGCGDSTPPSDPEPGGATDAASAESAALPKTAQDMPVAKDVATGEATPVATTDDQSESEPEGASISDKIAQIEAERTEAMKKFREWYDSASDEEKKDEFQKRYPDPEVYSARVLTLATDAPEDPSAEEALLWVAKNSRGAKAAEAVSILLERHGDNEEIADALPMLAYGLGEANEKTLRRAVESGQSDRVKGLGTLALAQFLQRMPGMKQMVEDNPAVAEQLKEDLGYITKFRADKKEVEELFSTALEKYGAITTRRGTIAEAAEAALFELQNLQVGMAAPDIKAADLDGVEFKLSDYKGKVVLLDFWGNW